jgi:hypothetical protein
MTPDESADTPEAMRARTVVKLATLKAENAARETADRTVDREAVDLSSILTSVIVWIRRYVVITDAQAVAIVLWVAHTHAILAADCTPYLQITSATKRAGKTRLLEVLEPIVPRPWLTGRTSAAALVRKIDATCPSLLLDESDAAFGGDRDYAEALRSILNSGYRKSGKATVCIGQGANITARDFQTFCPKAIAGIGRLPDTVADRAIALQLRRRTSDEPCDRWRERDGHREAAPLCEHLARWAAGALETLHTARPALPSGLGDRAADCWEPLLAIADLAGGEWPMRARRAALALTGSAEDSDPIVELLRDVADILPEYTQPVIPTKVLIEKLTALDDRPWATWRHDKPITGRGLARLLGPLGVHPVHLETLRGYRRDAFTESIARYLPIEASERQKANKDGHKPPDGCDLNGDSQTASVRQFEADSIGRLTQGHLEDENTGSAPTSEDENGFNV